MGSATKWQRLPTQLRRFFRSILRAVAGAVTLFAAATVVGLVPVNRDFTNAAEGIDVYIYRDAFHSEIMVPVDESVFAWRHRFDANHFRADARRLPYVAFGWGDREFFLQTPTWKDLQYTTTTRALLWPTDTVMHVTYCRQPGTGPTVRRVRLGPQQYRQLCETIWKSFRRDAADEITVLPGEAYGSYDAFYQATGSYWMFNTCNHWTGRVLRTNGVRTGLWTPFPLGIAQVPDDE